MRIEINQNRPALWGKLGIGETRTAAEKLSGDSFKAWVLLSLNQDGYVWQGDLEPHILQELADCGCLFPTDNENYVFVPDGEADGYNVPAEWSKIADLYGSSNQQDLSYVREKLEKICLSDKLEDILDYWVEKYTALQQIDHSKARNCLKYDFSVVLVWWLWDNFRFEVGDVLEFGTNASRLRFHDDAFQAHIVSRVQKRKITCLEMGSDIMPYWNQNFAAQKFEIPLDVVGNILKMRSDRRQV